MPRFFGLLLMTITSMVVGNLIVLAVKDPLSSALVLGATLLAIGVLLGFLDHLHFRKWAVLAAVVVAAGLYSTSLPTASPSPEPTPPPSPPPALTSLHYGTSTLALLAGSQLGALLIRRRIRAATQPQTDPE